MISGLFGGKKQAVPHTQPTISAPSTEKPVLSQSNEEGGFQGPTVENADVWFGNPDNIKAFEEWASKPGKFPHSILLCAISLT